MAEILQSSAALLYVQDCVCVGVWSDWFSFVFVKETKVQIL